MSAFLHILFFLSAYAIFHTYIAYPFLLYTLVKTKKSKNSEEDVYNENDLPDICIVCAAYNEESVIAEKIKSVFNTTYPVGKISFYIGTDACSDNTVEIIQEYARKYPEIRLFEFKQRTGKINIINELYNSTKVPVLIMTDANVYFENDTLFRLVKPLKDERVQMVCANIQKRPSDGGTVTKNELGYFNFENFLKSAESTLWNIVIGAEGGCYAIRRDSFIEVPGNFNVDDFFITSHVLRIKGRILFENKAIAYEDIASDSKGEYRRKTRIATGNFQNLFYFKSLLWPFWNATSFSYISHKVLRWLTPFFFVMNMLCSLLLANNLSFYLVVFYVELFILLTPVINLALQKVGIRIKIFVSFSHFVLMNVALWVGFFRYCRGVKSSVWQPVKR